MAALRTIRTVLLALVLVIGFVGADDLASSIRVRGTYLNYVEEAAPALAKQYFHKDQSALQATDDGFSVRHLSIDYSDGSGDLTIRIYSPSVPDYAGTGYETVILPAGTILPLSGHKIESIESRVLGGKCRYVAEN